MHSPSDFCVPPFWHGSAVVFLSVVVVVDVVAVVVVDSDVLVILVECVESRFGNYFFLNGSILILSRCINWFKLSELLKLAKILF